MAPGKSLGTMPILGGTGNFDVQYRGKRYLGGAFGLLILDDPRADLPAPWKRQEVEFVPTRDKRYREEANNTEVPVKTPSDLTRWLASPNPYLRKKAMQHVPRGNAAYWRKSDHWDRDDYCRALAMYPCPESFALLLETRVHELLPNGDKPSSPLCP